jgi:hypothetical protein
MEMNSDDSMSLSSESGWSSSDDSDIEELLQYDDVEMMSLLVDVQEIEDRAKLLDHRRGSVMGREYINRNRGLGHEQLMRDYFAKEHPTYPPRLFWRRYRMRRSLFVKIVNDCEAASDYFRYFASKVCHSPGSSSFLGQEDLAGHHDMLCDSTQHDHRG